MRHGKTEVEVCRAIIDKFIEKYPASDPNTVALVLDIFRNHAFKNNWRTIDKDMEAFSDTFYKVSTKRSFEEFIIRVFEDGPPPLPSDEQESFFDDAEMSIADRTAKKK